MAADNVRSGDLLRNKPFTPAVCECLQNAEPAGRTSNFTKDSSDAVKLLQEVMLESILPQMFCHDYKFSHFSFYIKMIFSYFLCALPLLRVSQVCLEKSKSCRCHFRSKILHLLHDYICFSFFLYGVLYQRQLCFKCFPLLYFCNLKFIFFDIIKILHILWKEGEYISVITFSQILFLCCFLYVFCCILIYLFIKHLWEVVFLRQPECWK